MLVMFDYEKAVAVKSCFFNVSNVCPCLRSGTHPVTRRINDFGIIILS